MVLFGGGCLYYAEELLHSIDSPNSLMGILILEPVKDIWEDPQFQDHIQSLRDAYSRKAVDLHARHWIKEEGSSKISEDSKGKDEDQTIQGLLGNIPKINQAKKIFLDALPFYKRNFPSLWEKILQEGEIFLHSKHLHSKGLISKTSSPNLTAQSTLGSESTTPGNVRETINTATIEKFSGTWTSSFCKNAKDCQDIVVLQPNPMLETKSMVYIGASPELEEEIPILEQVRSECFLIASDTSLKYLLSQNLIPHAVLSVDPGRGTYFHIPSAIPESIQIITWLGASREWFQRKIQPKIFLTTHPLDQFIQQYNGLDDSSIISNPSLNLAGLAVSLGKFWNFPRIFLSGFSLKSSYGKTHCRGTGYETYALPLTHRRKGLESLYPIHVYQKEITSKNKLASQTILEEKNSIPIQPISNYFSNGNLSSQSPPHPESSSKILHPFHPPTKKIFLPSKSDWMNFLGFQVPGVDRKILNKYINSCLFP